MRLFLEISNKYENYKASKYFTFKVESSYAPSNLWMIQDQSKEIIKGNTLHSFTYKKVLAVSYVTTTINNIEFHGKVVSIAEGNYGGVTDVLIYMGDEHPNYEFNQLNYSFWNGGETFIIDLDELKTDKNFENLSPVECFAKLINFENMGYDIRFNRFIVNSDVNKIIDSSEYLDMEESLK